MSAYLGAAIFIFILMNLVFILAFRLRRNDLADVVWGPGFVVAALGALFVRHKTLNIFSLSRPAELVLGVVLVWSLRLFWHLGLRTLKKDHEDVRYQKMRTDWGVDWKWKSYLYVFMLQGFLMYGVALPVFHIIDKNPDAYSPVALLGFVIWFFGFLFEAISDAQLKKFKSKGENRGQIMTQGLWSWSRHPNYFGEVVQWWGVFFMSCASFESLWIVISPILITFLILKVSGVPLLEDLMQDRPGFEEYQRRTSLFFPWPPKKT